MAFFFVNHMNSETEDGRTNVRTQLLLYVSLKPNI